MVNQAPLPTVRLGTTDMFVSRVGMGAWGFGGANWGYAIGEQDDAVSVKTIRHCFDMGVNWVDTAPVYGYGHSEAVIGRALREMPAGQRPYVFTKCGSVFDEAEPSRALPFCGRPESIRREVEASLRRLGVEHIDLYQMHHVPNDGSQLEDYWLTMHDLKREGKVRAVGLSNHDTPRLEAAAKLGVIDTLQMHFSAIQRDLAAKEMSFCHANNVGLLVYSPMQSGLLSGRFSPDKRASLSRDVRVTFPDFNGDQLSRNLALADALRPIAERYGVSVAAVAVAWTLAWPGVTGAIVGARSPEQADEWVAAGALNLQPQDMLEIRAAILRTKVGRGPTIPPQIVLGEDAEPGEDVDADLQQRPRYNAAITTAVGQVIVNVNDVGIGRDLMNTGNSPEKGRNLLNLCLSQLIATRPRVVCLDIGAHVGTGTLQMAQAVGVTGKVHAFEAQRAVYYMLAGSVALNCLENIWCHHKLVGGACGDVEMPQFNYARPLNLGKVEFGPMQREDIGQIRQNRRSKRETVPMVTIDSLNFDEVSLMRVDVEGMDWDVLQGAQQTVARCKPVIIANYGKTDVQGMLRFFGEHSYRVFVDETKFTVYCVPASMNFSLPGLPVVAV